MNSNTKVTFTLSIGYVTASHEEVFTLEELGYDPKVDTDINTFLEKAWQDWIWEFIDGSWKIEDGDGS